MKSITHKINPTGLKNLDRKLATVRLDSISKPPRFRLESLNLDGVKMQNGLDIILLAEAGNTKLRTLVGKTGRPLDQVWIEATELDHSSHFTFRIAFRFPDNPRIVASIDGIRPVCQHGFESLVDMVSSDLGEQVWTLEMDSNRPVLHVNSSVFSSTSGAESFLPFSAVVMPEVLARVLEKIGDDPALLENGTDWSDWKDFIMLFAPDLLEAEDESIKQELINDAVRKFCNKYKFASRLKTELERKKTND
ncbi:MAG: hypothetical protein FJ308_19580 [Planctomycetes bacterium]|nr:hypothetical protein [Planctomycetota bacterium]